MPETIKLNLSYQADDYIVKADPTRLQQVFINLAVNARDAMPNGGLLEFRLNKLRLTEEAELPVPDMPLGDWVSITVIDTGTGIAQTILPHIFEPFFTTKPVGQGTGLGLAQVYGIIKQHDGYIDVESRQGMGTQFNIYLPAQPVHVALPGSGGLVNPVDGSGQAVLIVEDDPATLEALQALLKAFNYNVIAARNGREALQIYNDRPQPISLIVSDIVMPRMGGVALYRALHEEDPEVKFLFVTGHPLDEDIQVLLEQGLVHWLQKPFSVREFNQAVRSIVQG
jgi:CheY-like chemotaxis protein